MKILEQARGYCEHIFLIMNDNVYSFVNSENCLDNVEV